MVLLPVGIKEQSKFMVIQLKKFWESMYPSLAPSHLNNETMKVSELVKKEKRLHHYETFTEKKGWKDNICLNNLSPVFDNHGKLTAISVISRDITEREKKQKKLWKKLKLPANRKSIIGLRIIFK